MNPNWYLQMKCITGFFLGVSLLLFSWCLLGGSADYIWGITDQNRANYGASLGAVNIALWWRLDTYFSQPIHPFWYPVSCQLVAYVLTEMVAVLHNQVICIPIVISSMAFHELFNFVRIQIRHPHQNWLSEFETRALSRFNFKDATCRIVMGSKSIFNAMH